MARTYVVTGANSGIGAAAVARLTASGAQVIRCDLSDSDVDADLTTPEGRRALVAGVAEASGGAVDGLLAVAGVAMPLAAAVRLNYFGTVACLEGLRPLLAAGDRPGAVVVSSLGGVIAVNDAIVDACLAGDEEAAVAEADTTDPERMMTVDNSTKRALNLWVRRTAPSADWAGAGITLNAVAPGVVDTATARAAILDNPAASEAAQAMMPQPMGFPGPVAAVAAALEWTVSPDNSFMTGQVLYVDGGADAVLRGDRY